MQVTRHVSGVYKTYISFNKWFISFSCVTEFICKHNIQTFFCCILTVANNVELLCKSKKADHNSSFQTKKTVETKATATLSNADISPKHVEVPKYFE